jgi:predicted O-methyltransferase YrrM
LLPIQADESTALTDGWEAVHRREYARAGAIAVEQMELGRRSIGVLLLRTSCAIALGYAAEAEALVAEMLALEPGHPQAVLFRGEINLTAGRIGEAEADVRDVIARTRDASTSDWAVNLLGRVATARLIHDAFGGLRTLRSTDSARALSGEAVTLSHGLTGCISVDDGRFLLSLVEQAGARHLLEIGVASGLSSFVMLKGLAEMGGASTLTSVDLLDYYYADPSRRVGFVVFDNFAVLPPDWTLIDRRSASDFASSPKLRAQELSRRYDFLFVDAHHGHPWPTLDVLCVLPFMAPGSWVALHDVSLCYLNEKWTERGPHNLLKRWPFDACIGDGPVPNIGAIRLSDAGPEDADQLLTILEMPWDCGLTVEWEHTISHHLASFLSAAQMDQLGSTFDRQRRREVV